MGLIWLIMMTLADIYTKIESLSTLMIGFFAFQQTVS